ncbi:hypothetical protein P7C70_g3789, partial [Phenoliferia sp. Uapishka_3]
MPPRAKRATTKEITDEYQEEEERDEEDNYEPPVKKAKAKTSTAAKGKGRRAKLELFTNLPLDVVTDICHMLDPPTLLALTRTSRVLRHVVTGPNSTAIWDSAFESSDRIRTHHPQALECAPHSMWGGSMYYWAPTVAHISALLYNLDSKQQKDPSKPVFDKFVTKAKKNAKRAISDGKALQGWEDGEANRRAQRNDDAKMSRKKKIEAKMIELGYNAEDSPHVNQPKDLTERIWENIKPHLILILEEARVRKARFIAAQAAQARRVSLVPLYQALRAACPPDLQEIFPPKETVYGLASVTAIWQPEPAEKKEDAPDPLSPEVLLPLHSTAIFAEIRSNFQQLEIKVFASLTKAHAEAGDLSNDAAKNYTNTPVQSSDNMAVLSQKITSSLKCSRCKVLLPFPAIVPHYYDQSKDVHPSMFSFRSILNEGLITTSKNQVHCICTILEKLELSEESTTVAELDAMGKCFGCKDCPGKVAQQVEAGGVEVKGERMMWYELVAHALNGHIDNWRSEPVYSPPKVLIYSIDEEEFDGPKEEPGTEAVKQDSGETALADSKTASASGQASTSGASGGGEEMQSSEKVENAVASQEENGEDGIKMED